MSTLARTKARVAPKANNVEVMVARDLNALQKVFALRTLVYMGEQSCPFEEEFDGNDFAGSTHLLAEIDGQPVGTMRLRWFSDFAKFERVAVKHSHRRAGVVPCMLAKSFELARERGYTRVLAHMQERLVPFWEPFGFRPRPGREHFAFSDHEYVECEALLDRHPDALCIDTDPMVINRPEGAWREPGVLDFSAERPASNPHL